MSSPPTASRPRRRRPSAARPAGWPAPPAPAACHGLAGKIVETIAPHTEADPVAIFAQLLVGAGAARRTRRLVRGRSHPSPPQRVRRRSSATRAKARKGSSWDHVARTARPRRPGLHRPGRPGCPPGEGLIWAAPRPRRHRPRRHRPPPAGGRARVRHRAQSDRPRRLHAVPGAALRLGRPPPRPAHPHRPRPRHRRPHRRHRPHHRRRARPPHQRPRNRQRVLEPLLLHRLPTHPATARRRRPRPARRHRHRSPPRRPPRRRPPGRTRSAQPRRPPRLARRLHPPRRTRRRHRRRPPPAPKPTCCASPSSTPSSTATPPSVSPISKPASPCGTTPPVPPPGRYEPAAADPIAEQIHTALTASPDGLTRTQLRDLYGRNLPGARIDAALVTLGHSGRAQRHRVTTGGRPAEIWRATPPNTAPRH